MNSPREIITKNIRVKPKVEYNEVNSLNCSIINTTFNNISVISQETLYKTMRLEKKITFQVFYIFFFVLPASILYP
jgi:hypothetical protein